MPTDAQPLTVLDSRGQRIALSWHPGHTPPEGRCHGSAGICLLDRSVVLVSTDGRTWDFPAGRPEPGETWEQTLRREMLEEACARVTDARLLGFARGHCLEGPERGLVLVRAVFLAHVELQDWQPKFETRFRRLVPAPEAIAQVPHTFHPIWRRAFATAGL